MNDPNKQSQTQFGEDMRLNPELRLCPRFDYTSIARYHVAGRDDMGVRVVDNFPEEHIM